MKYFLIAALLLAATGAQGSERVPGTKVSIDRPEGFSSATQFPGFVMEETGSSVMVTEIPGPFQEISGGLTKEGLGTRGVILISKETVQAGTRQAVLMQASQVADQTKFLKWMLVFGNDKESVFIVATYPEIAKDDLGDKLRAVLLTAEWDLEAKIDHFEGLTFRLSEFGDLKIAKKMGNNLFLTRQGEFPQQSPGAPVFIAGSSFSESWPIPADHATFTKSRLLQFEMFEGFEILGEESVEIDGLKGTFLDAEATRKGTNDRRSISLCLLFTDNGYYIFHGMVAVTAKEKYAPIFKEILNSFKRI